MSGNLPKPNQKNLKIFPPEMIFHRSTNKTEKERYIELVKLSYFILLQFSAITPYYLFWSSINSVSAVKYIFSKVGKLFIYTIFFFGSNFPVIFVK